MLELPTLGPITTILLILTLSGIVSWGLTQLVKTTIIWYRHEFHDDWWFNLLIRSVALGVGGYFGFMLLNNIVGIGLGLAGGTLNATIVTIVKNKLKNIKSTGSIELDDDHKDPPTGS
jgi:hypothetical protein